MDFEILAFALLAISVQLAHSQRIRWEDEATTVRVDYRHKQEVDYDSESKTISSADRRGSSNNELVSKQYFSQQPYFPPNPPFQFQYNKYSTQASSNNWGDWTSTQQARKPSLVQFPGESYETSVPATSVNSVSSNSRRKTSTASSSTVRTDDTCHCGMIPYEKDTKKLQRIVGGIVSKDNSWPWMVAVAYIGQTKPFWFCGGSLISDKYVLTAGTN
ncbi:Plasminogen [Orchesella cincta]|uniref:Plasminogen n=1 Tax=Orchesella cincta TaxID=48709 RepID=A0A1D2NI93_ORCCI|nr:Plasminogen [Orchesella cincta]